MSERLPHSSPTPVQVPDEPVPRPLQWIKDNGLPITGFLLLVLVFCLIAHYSSVRIDWATTHQFTGSIQNVVQVLALCAGGWWAYFKFVKGRTFQQSLSAAVTGRFVVLDGDIYLITTIQVKNVGASRIDLDGQVSALILYEYAPRHDAEVHALKNKRLTSFDVFDGKIERYVEPKEDIEVQQLISLPSELRLAYRLEAHIVSTAGFVWKATSIVAKASVGDNTADLLVTGERNE
jgi:hypothetical protein